MDTYAWALHVHGYSEEAEEIMKRVVKYDRFRFHIDHLKEIQKKLQEMRG